nr:MAG TPA: hypothetical protein [Caudoviricetes sp.]
MRLDAASVCCTAIAAALKTSEMFIVYPPSLHEYDVLHGSLGDCVHSNAGMRLRLSSVDVATDNDSALGAILVNVPQQDADGGRSLTTGFTGSRGFLAISRHRSASLANAAGKCGGIQSKGLAHILGVVQDFYIRRCRNLRVFHGTQCHFLSLSFILRQYVAVRFVVLRGSRADALCKCDTDVFSTVVLTTRADRSAKRRGRLIRCKSAGVGLALCFQEIVETFQRTVFQGQALGFEFVSERPLSALGRKFDVCAGDSSRSGSGIVPFCNLRLVGFGVFVVLGFQLIHLSFDFIGRTGVFLQLFQVLVSVGKLGFQALGVRLGRFSLALLPFNVFAVLSKNLVDDFIL